MAAPAADHRLSRALCALLAVQALTNPGQVKVWVMRTDMSLGQVITSSDVVLSNLPTSPPQAVRTSPVGRKLSIDLPKGTALIESMLTGPALSHLGKQQRVVQLQIQTGSQLARIGQQVDIVGTVASTTNSGVVSSDGAYSQAGAQVLAQKVTIVDVEPPNKANLTQTQGTMRLITFAVRKLRLRFMRRGLPGPAFNSAQTLKRGRHTHFTKTSGENHA